MTREHNKFSGITYGDRSILNCVGSIIRSDIEAHHSIILYQINPAKLSGQICFRCTNSPDFVIVETDHLGQTFITAVCDKCR